MSMDIHSNCAIPHWQWPAVCTRAPVHCHYFTNTDWLLLSILYMVYFDQEGSEVNARGRVLKTYMAYVYKAGCPCLWDLNNCPMYTVNGTSQLYSQSSHAIMTHILHTQHAMDGNRAWEPHQEVGNVPTTMQLSSISHYLRLTSHSQLIHITGYHSPHKLRSPWSHHLLLFIITF